MAEFHPELTEKQRADRLLSLQLEALNIREAIAETKHQLDVLKSMDDDEIDTSDILEVQDWSGAERGKFYRPVESIETCVTLNDVTTSLKPSDLKEGTIMVIDTAGTLVSEDYAWAEGRIKEMNDQIKQTMAIPSTDQLVQHLVEKFGIDPDKLRISVIQHQVEMAPDRDLEINVGTLEPANPVFDALNAMRNQFEHPSLRMVNRDESKDSRDPE